MALYVNTKDANALLNKLKKAIRDNQVRTWEIDQDGDYTYVPEQWKNEAWIRYRETRPTPQCLVFGIVARKSKLLTKTVYGIYMGRFAEMLSTHFDDDFDSIEISSKLVRDVDVFNPDMYK